MSVILRYLLSLTFFGFIFFSFPAALCAAPVNIKPGIWRGILQRPDGHQIVFNFEAVNAKGKQALYIINGDDRLLVDSVTQSGDSIWIVMPFFASRFYLRLTNQNFLQGTYMKNLGNRNMSIPFTATYGRNERYHATRRPTADFSGRWAVSFFSAGKDSTEAVGEFVQNSKGKITGTFLMASGDYRYLHGIVSGDSLYMSGFDGGYAILFTAKLDTDNKISDAHLYSGVTNHSQWVAHRDPKAKLPDGYSHTKLRPGENRLNFRFPDTNGDTVSIDDSKYQNKVVIIQILGSWCPNCLDETQFLSDYYNKNSSKGVEIIGLAYERTEDYNTSKTALEPFRRRFNVKYPFLITGVTVSDTLKTEKTLPQLDKIESFPTSIFIDRKGVVRKIHSGYDGPATGEHYEAFKKEFYELMNSLLKE